MIANTIALDLSLRRDEANYFEKFSLFEEDWNILKSNYIHHWGTIYVAGKKFLFDSDTRPQIFSILIPGNYTYEGECGVSINKVHYQPGNIIKLKKGIYEIKPDKIPAVLILRWGDHLYKPSNKPIAKPIFVGF